MYRAVRLGGGIPWNKVKNQPEKRRVGMRKLLLTLVAVMLVFVPLASAEPVHNTLNGAFDAPHLIGLKQLSPDLWLGVEGTKGVATNLFYESFQGIEDDYNYQIFAKLTYDGCFLNCPSK